MSNSLKRLVAAGAVALGALGAPAVALSDEVTVTLSVPDMTCAACPITVRKSLERVDGVIRAEAYLETQTAVVTYDDAKTDTKALTEATEWYGYPSTVVKGSS